MKPFVSVIIPFYNTPERHFDRCIRSVIGQTFSDFEVIVIDDGSSQQYNDLLDKVDNLDKRIRVIHKENEGSAVARNTGIKEAQGEYVMFLDSDDVLTEYCLEEAQNVVVNQCVDLVIGGVKKISEREIDKLHDSKNNNATIIRVDSKEKREMLMSHMVGRTNEEFVLSDGYVADGPTARLLRAEIANKALFSKEAFWNDDVVWNTKMLRKCNNIVIIDDLWYWYLIYPNSKTRKYRPNCPSEFKYRTKQEIVLFKKLWPNCMNAIYTRVFNDIVLLCRTFLFHSQNSISEIEKYKIYKQAIHTKSYREVLCNISFDEEKRIVYKLLKQLMRFTSYYGPNIISYMILKAFYIVKRDSL